MNKTMLSAAALSLACCPAFAADLGVPLPVAAPVFGWTSCYAGGHAGGGMAQNDMTDPVQLVQDSFLGLGTTTGVTTASFNSTGFVGGGQIGCDYEFSARWVLGVVGEISGSTLTGNTTVGLPLGLPGESALVSAKTDFIPSVSGRFGYALDRVLLYAKGGVAWAGSTYDVTGTFTGIPFAFEGLDMRTGFVAGGGIEWAVTGPWSVSLEYDYYGFGHGSVLMSDPVNVLSGPVDTKLSIQVVKLGINFHAWASDW